MPCHAGARVLARLRTCAGAQNRLCSEACATALPGLPACLQGVNFKAVSPIYISTLPNNFPEMKTIIIPSELFHTSGPACTTQQAAEHSVAQRSSSPGPAAI